MVTMSVPLTSDLSGSIASRYRLACSLHGHESDARFFGEISNLMEAGLGVMKSSRSIIAYDIAPSLFNANVKYYGEGHEIIEHSAAKQACMLFMMARH